MKILKNILKIENRKYEFKNYKNNKTYYNLKNKKIYDIKYYDLKIRLKNNFKYNNISIINYKNNIIKYYIK